MLVYAIIFLLATCAVLGWVIFKHGKATSEASLELQDEIAIGVNTMARSLASIGSYIPVDATKTALHEFLGPTPQGMKISNGMVPISVLLTSLLEKGWIVFKEYRTYSRVEMENCVCLFCEAPLPKAPTDDYSPSEHRLVLELVLSTATLEQLKSESDLSTFVDKTGKIDLAQDCIFHFLTECDDVCRTDMQVTVSEIYKANKVTFNFTLKRTLPGHISTQSYNHQFSKLTSDTMEHTEIPVSILNKSYTLVKIGTVEKKAGDFAQIFEKLHGKRKVNMLISGGLGTGKTTLAASLLFRVQNAATIVVLNARQLGELLSNGDVFQNIRKDASSGKKHIIFIDEAQLLTKEIASELGEVMDGKHSHENVSTIISSDDTMPKEIKEVLLRPGRTHIEVELKPLTTEQWMPLVNLIELESKSDPNPKKWKQGPTGDLTLAQIHNNFEGLSIEEDVEMLSKENI